VKSRVRQLFAIALIAGCADASSPSGGAGGASGRGGADQPAGRGGGAGGGGRAGSGGTATASGGAGSAGSSSAGASTGGGGAAAAGTSGLDAAGPRDDGIAGLVACDDFEGGAVGAIVGKPWQEKNYCQCHKYHPVITDKLAFSGTKSVSTNQDAAFRLYLAPHLDDVYVRMMLWIDKLPDDHWTWTEAETYTDPPGDPLGQGYSDDYSLRFGQQGTRWLVNNWAVGNGEVLAADENRAHALPVGRWVCVEMHFDRTRVWGELWLDGARMDLVSQPWTKEHAPPFPWKAIVFGQENYHPSDSIMYLDDVAVATSRIGCP
jgi:hypothetical protein